MTAGKQAHGSAHTKKSDERSTMTRMHSSTKRPRAPIACFRCHHKKVRCDGLHPNCTRCLSTGVLCAYPSSRRSRNTQPTNVDPFIDNLSQLEARIRRIENDLVSQRALIESANPSASASASESVTLHGGQVDSSTSSSSSSTAAFSMSSPQISTPTVAADLTKQMVKIEQEVQESRAILAQLRLRGEQRIARGKRAAASSSTCSSSASSSSTSAGMSLPKPRTENSTSTSAFPKNDGHQPYLKHRKISSSVSVSALQSAAYGHFQCVDAF
ncbi:uncharacterized protein BYT42DRAFT_603071 [Radiomyces spectabilis]|uniref:uncharacterized protein n=1 Tax=Radiomyces spectabilis TaxID=64574 RepID=UPI002220D206|nr:uncharacterized protein BYT42DRAFT_603071 [Radiomyces spectabilis]KAI8388588.1 hypothetical protein BYT42DRAFT_603071 [Radiomyces spectabilis]